jgi:hypothetical protein
MVYGFEWILPLATLPVGMASFPMLFGATDIMGHI